MFSSGLICILKALEFQESDLKALRVFEIGFGSWMPLIFLLNKIEKNQRLEVLKLMKTNVQVYREYNSRNSYKMCQNTCFFPHCSFITFVHVHWATNAQWMSGLPVFSSSPCIVWHFCMWTCWCPKHSFQRKHFAWLKVNSYKLK